MKEGWGVPLYTLHSTTSGMAQLFIYHVRINALGVTFQPTKLSPSIEDAQKIAAEYCLLQLGYSYTTECELCVCPSVCRVSVSVIESCDMLA